MQEAPVATPLCRAFLLGEFRMEWLVPSVEADAWESRTAARAVFLLLVCAPNRQATRGALIGVLWPELDEEKARESLRTALKALRRVLTTTDEQHLLETQHGGELLKLKGQEVLWTDIDAFDALLTQASTAATPEEALPFWQQARALLSGELLVHDRLQEWIDCPWIRLRKQALDRSRRRLIRYLSKAYLSGGQRMQAEALLAEHLIRFPTDQDALYRLMKLLVEQDGFEEALDYYERCRLLLSKREREPEVALQDLAKHVRQRARALVSKPLLPAPAVAPVSSTNENGALPVLVTASPPHDGQMHLSPAQSPALLPIVVPAQAHPDRLHGIVQGADPQDLGTWIAQEALRLGNVFEQGWSLESVMAPLEAVLPIARAFPALTRPIFLSAGVPSPISTQTLPIGRAVSEAGRIQLCQAFNESIAQGWKLFTQGKNAQALAVAQAQLALLQHVHTLLSLRDLSLLSSSIYNFLGTALKLQKQYQEALDAHKTAYLAALGAGETLNIAYVLLGQADDYAALGQYDTTIETVQQALRVLSVLGEQQPVLLKAHLLGVWADSAMCVGDYPMACQKLDALAALLDELKPNEEFDRANWSILRGKCAGLTGDYTTAAQWCEQALQELPQDATMRRTLALMPLLAAYACLQDLDASLLVLEKARQIIPLSHAPLWKQPLRQVLQQGFLVVFPHETRVKTIVAELMQYLG